MKTRKACKQIASRLIAVLSTGFAAGQQEKTLRQSESAKYLGSNTCETCHEEIHEKKFENTPHFNAALDPAHMVITDAALSLDKEPPPLQMEDVKVKQGKSFLKTVPSKKAGLSRVKVDTELSNSEILAPDNVWVPAVAARLK